MGSTYNLLAEWPIIMRRATTYGISYFLFAKSLAKSDQFKVLSLIGMNVEKDRGAISN